MGVRTHICVIIWFQTQGTKPRCQNCKWAVLSFLAWLTGKMGELRNGYFFHLLEEKLGKIMCTYLGYKDFHGCCIFIHYIRSFIHCMDCFLVTWGVRPLRINCLFELTRPETFKTAP